jgi:predicted nucleic acid-binding protein
MSGNIIFDTSVWIEYFKGNDAYFDTCRQFIEKGTVKTLELIFAELLQGARNKKEIETIKAYYELIPKPEIDRLYLLAGEYSQKEKLTGKGIGLIDACIITATVTTNSKLWTLDKKIKAFLHKKYLYEF